MTTTGWKFIGDKGNFIIDQPTKTNYLYFPLVNEAGMMSSITPTLHGDINTGQNSFVTPPVSAIDLINSKATRNFWLRINNESIWSATGVSADQEAQSFNEACEQKRLKAGMLWHQLTITNDQLGITSEITNVVPAADEQIELMQVKLTNTSERPMEITPIAAIPLYGRSADNLRDHRHVTSLLNVIETTADGVILEPTLSFDERGHTENDLSYQVLGRDDEGNQPIGFYPVYEEFIGEGGSLTWPKTVVEDNNDFVEANEQIQGYEAMGALRFNTVTLEPGASKKYILAIGVQNKQDKINLCEKYCSIKAFEKVLTSTQEFWNLKVKKATIESNDQTFDHWMKWVTIQPTLRRYYGNSFLPHHDYGRGGRGWRDLWQDCLALLMMEPGPVRTMLYNNFAGIRIDGSNATIIGSKPGEFIADRNGINRVWMDHGAWPFLTTQLYIDRTGDINFLFEKQSYFKDNQLDRSTAIDEQWSEAQGNQLLDAKGNVYEGTLLEHLLVQHLTIFFNVGDHNILKLEGGDWNDGLDMAEERGESVAFTGFYGKNMLEIAKLLKQIKQKKTIETIEVSEELMVLLDTLTDQINYDAIDEKRRVLKDYFKRCRQQISGHTIQLKIDELILDLERKGQWIFNHLRDNEWLTNDQGYSWYNGYYDNEGKRVDGDHPLGTRMTLTGQVFSIMNDVATTEQIEEIIQSADHYLKDESVGGYRLNTNFNEVKLNLGRAFGFAYGEKENGAMFSHMAIMYANALYQRNFAKAGYQVIKLIFDHCRNFEKSRIYPGIPEYINNRGRGLYTYLTGSASWLLLTMVNQIYGIQGTLGDLTLAPQLVCDQFDDNDQTSIATVFNQKPLKVIYKNPKLKSVDDYIIKDVKLNGKLLDCIKKGSTATISQDKLKQLSDQQQHVIEVTLQ